MFSQENRGYAYLFPLLKKVSQETRRCIFCVSLCFLTDAKKPILEAQRFRQTPSGLLVTVSYGS